MDEELVSSKNEDSPIASGKYSEDRMEAAERRTVVAHSSLTMREVRLDAARHHRHGLQVMTFEGIVTLNARTSFGVACRDANHLIHTPSISA